MANRNKRTMPICTRQLLVGSKARSPNIQGPSYRGKKKSSQKFNIIVVTSLIIEFHDLASQVSPTTSQSQFEIFMSFSWVSRKSKFSESRLWLESSTSAEWTNGFPRVNDTKRLNAFWLTAASRRRWADWCPGWGGPRPSGSTAWWPIRHSECWLLPRWPAWPSCCHEKGEPYQGHVANNFVDDHVFGIVAWAHSWRRLTCMILRDKTKFYFFSSFFWSPCCIVRWK